MLNISNSTGISSFLELGPGNGTLMSDVIRTISSLSKEEFEFYLYEKSRYLRYIQSHKLKSQMSSKSKIETLKNLKLDKKSIFFFCNEFFDALPVNQIVKRNNKIYEKRVNLIDDNFDFCEHIINNKKFEFLLNGEIYEYSPLTTLYARRIFQHIKKFGGYLLFFDYGPYKKERISTVQAIHKSEKCSIFDFPFKSDITYHVDFKSLEILSKNFGLNFYGPVSQRKFLYYHGINERINSLINKTKSQQKKLELEQQFYRLTDPNGMGDLFKCVFISRDEWDLTVFRN